MPFPRRVAELLERRQNRLILTAAIAFCWLLLIVGSTEAYGNPAAALFYGTPAVLVLFFWRTRPVVALALAALVVVLVAVVGAGGGSGITALLSGSLAIAGGQLADDRNVRWSAYGLLALEALLSVMRGVFIPSFIFALLTAIGVVVWQQFGRRTAVLKTRLDESTARGDAAERDVLLEVERNRIAREVHDVVAHSLAVVIAQADGARFAAETKPETVAPALEAIGDTARRALGEVRTMLHDLRTSGDGTAPGAEDLDALVDGVRELGVRVDRDVWGEPAPLDRVAGLALYRIAQEALTNAMRHGDRSEPVGFELDWGERQVVLVVTNAVSGEVPAATERAGQGLVGMRERAADAGGDCTAGPGSNGRFRVRVVLPVAPAPAPVLEPEAGSAADPLSVLLGRLGVGSHA